MDSQQDYKKNVFGALSLFLLVATLFVGMKFISEIRNYGTIGSSDYATINVSGYGEVTAVPDIANIYFTISNDADTAKEAQDETARVEGEALEVVRSYGIEEKDIKTTNASFSPKYEWQTIRCITYPCEGGRNEIVGYTSSETINVKVRNTDDVGDLMEELSAVGVSNLNGPNFSIDNEDDLKAEARKAAIVDAKEKAEILAKDLGVRLNKVLYFQEGGDYGYYGMGGDQMMMSAESSKIAPSQAELPRGENTIVSNITITYEIR